MIKLQVGRVYEVSFSDCCVGGSFTSTLARIRDYHDEETFREQIEVDSTWDLGELSFTNGVTITNAGSCKFELKDS